MADEESGEPASGGPTWWWHVRAALILAHIAAVVVLAVPDTAGSASRRQAWKNPTVQNELGAWAERLSAWGWAVSREELEARAWDAANTWTGWMRTARAPIQPYSQVTGVRQRWRMFVAPHRHPATLHIDVQQGGAWAPIYIARSDEFAWRRAAMDDTRVRSMLFRYAWPQYRGHYRRFAVWVAKRVLQDFPGAAAVRVRWYGFKTPSPEQVREGRVPPGKFRAERVFQREDLL